MTQKIRMIFIIITVILQAVIPGVSAGASSGENDAKINLAEGKKCYAESEAGWWTADYMICDGNSDTRWAP